MLELFKPEGFGQSRRTRTPLLFTDMISDWGQYGHYPPLILINKNLKESPKDLSSTIQHEGIHAILAKTGVPQGTSFNKLQPLLTRLLRDRGYGYLSSEDTINEELANVMTNGNDFPMDKDLRDRFIKDSLNTLRLKGKDVSVLEGMIK